MHHVTHHHSPKKEKNLPKQAHPQRGPTAKKLGCQEETKVTITRKQSSKRLAKLRNIWSIRGIARIEKRTNTKCPKQGTPVANIP
jgi:hypothetical protein